MKIKYYKNPYVDDKMYPRVIISRGDKGFAVMGGESLMKGLGWSKQEIRDFPGGEKDNRITRKQAEKILGKGLRQFIAELRNEPVGLHTYQITVIYSYDDVIVHAENADAAKKIALLKFSDIEISPQWGTMTMSPKISDCQEIPADKK